MEVPERYNTDRLTRVLSDKEIALIKYCRKLGFGKITLHVENGLPERVIEAQKSIKL